MNRHEISELMRSGEDNFVEFKPPSVNKADIRLTLGAFANSLPPDRVGRLLIGVGDDGRLIGCPNTDELHKRIREAAQDCYPTIAARCEAVAVDGVNILVVTVEPSEQRPHFVGAAYVRQRSESVKASPALFDEMVASRNSKTGALLRIKGQTVTTVGLGHKLGSTRRDLTRDYREQAECKVLGCDALRVDLQFLASQAFFSEALDRVEIDHDHERNRPRLIITGRCWAMSRRAVCTISLVGMREAVSGAPRRFCRYFGWYLRMACVHERFVCGSRYVHHRRPS